MTKRLPVTDHAVVRYLERVVAIDVDAIRQRIHDHTHQALAHGARGITSNGITYRFAKGRVVSVWVAQAHLKPLKWNKGEER